MARLRWSLGANSPFVSIPASVCQIGDRHLGATQKVRGPHDAENSINRLTGYVTVLDLQLERAFLLSTGKLSSEKSRTRDSFSRFNLYVNSERTTRVALLASLFPLKDCLKSCDFSFSLFSTSLLSCILVLYYKVSSGYTPKPICTHSIQTLPICLFKSQNISIAQRSSISL